MWEDATAAAAAGVPGPLTEKQVKNQTSCKKKIQFQREIFFRRHHLNASSQLGTSITSVYYSADWWKYQTLVGIIVSIQGSVNFVIQSQRKQIEDQSLTLPTENLSLLVEILANWQLTEVELVRSSLGSVQHPNNFTDPWLGNISTSTSQTPDDVAYCVVTFLLLAPPSALDHFPWWSTSVYNLHTVCFSFNVSKYFDIWQYANGAGVSSSTKELL